MKNTELNDQLELREIVLKIRQTIRELYNKKLFIIMTTALFVVGIALYTLNQPIVYPARLTYVLNNGGNSSVSGFASILGSLGLRGGESRQVNLPLIINVSKSGLVIGQSLLDKAVVRGKEDYIGNHLIEIENLRYRWRKDTSGLKDYEIKYPIKNKFLFEKAKKKMINFVVGNNGSNDFFKSNYDENSGLLEMRVNSLSPELAVAFVNNMYNHIDTFFLERIMEKQRLNLDLLVDKRDSIQTILTATENELAFVSDRSMGVYNKRAKLKEIRLSGKVNLLQQALIKLVENVEIADFTLKFNTSYLQRLDSPTLPIFPNRRPLIMRIILGSIVGFLSGCFLVICRRIYKNAIKE